MRALGIMDSIEEIPIAERNKDARALRAALSKGETPAPVLIRLLPQECYDLHEDIVFDLGLMGDPNAIEAIVKAIDIQFEHLVRWGNLHEFRRKCTYALACIATEESRAALEALTHNEDPNIREYAAEGLSKWPLPYKK